MKTPTKRELNILELSLRMAGVFCDYPALETILIVQDYVNKMGGNFSLKEASEIQLYIENKYKKSKVKGK
jgi:hypothetical protein